MKRPRVAPATIRPCQSSDGKAETQGGRCDARFRRQPVRRRRGRGRHDGDHRRRVATARITAPGDSNAERTIRSPDHQLDTFHWDFNVIGEAVRQALQDVFGGIATGIQQHVFAPITQSSLNLLTRTPLAGTYANATVIGLWSYTRDVASLGFVVVLVISGYSIMMDRATGTPFADALGRLRDAVLGFLLANTSLWRAALAIDLGNSLTSGIGAISLPDLAATGFAGSALETILLGIVYLIMGILLILQMLMRLALLDILLIVAPLAVLVGVLPQGRHWTRFWTDLFVGTLLTQFVQILVLRLGNDVGGKFLASMARRARKYFLGLTVISQDVGDFLGSVQGRAVLQNSAVKVLLRQDPSAIDRVVDTLKLSDGERDLLLRFGKGQALLCIPENRVAVEITAAPAEHRLITTDPRELAVLEHSDIAEHREGPDEMLEDRSPGRSVRRSGAPWSPDGVGQR